MRTFAGTESQNGLFACIILYPSPLVRSTRPATCASTVVVDAAYRSGGKIFQVFRGCVFTFSTLRVIMRFFLPLTAYREGNAFTGVCHSVQGGGRYVCLVPGLFGEGCACLVPASFGEGRVCLVAGHFQGVGMLNQRTLLGGTPGGGWLYQGGLGIPGGILRGGYNSCGKVMFSQVSAILSTGG